MGLVSKKLRNSARGQPCMFRIPYCCNNDPATTVLAHSPSESKGMANKSHDFLAAFACSACHDWIDGRGGGQHELRTVFWLDALKRQWVWWVEEGFVKIIGDDEKPTPRATKLSKILPYRPLGQGAIS